MRSLAFCGTITCMLLCFSAACSKPSNETTSASSSASVESHDHDHDEPCEDDRSTSQLLHPTPTTTTDENGNSIAHFGPAFTIEPRTPVADIQKSPTSFVGRNARLEGFVTAGCKRRRGWFAIVDDRRSGTPLRVLTTPSFRVPVDAIGKRVRVEGKVISIEIPASTARHMAEEHSLPMPKETTGNSIQTVLEAVSAEFY